MRWKLTDLYYETYGASRGGDVLSEKEFDAFYEKQADTEYLQVPVLGRVAAGEPLLAVEEASDVFPLPMDFASNKDLFMLTVRGESMIEAAILDGDYIIVARQQTANNGDIVVALVDDSATVKTFYKENGHFRLQPENSTMEPIIVSEVMILRKGCRRVPENVKIKRASLPSFLQRGSFYCPAPLPASFYESLKRHIRIGNVPDNNRLRNRDARFTSILLLPVAKIIPKLALTTISIWCFV